MTLWYLFKLSENHRCRIREIFKVAGQTLAEICGEVFLDNWVALDPFPINEAWVATYAQYISPYFLHIVKYPKWESYGEFRTSWLRLFPNRFLPVPITFRQLRESPIVPFVQDTRPTDLFLGLLPLFINENLGTSKIDFGDNTWKKPCLFTLSCRK